MNNTNNMNNLLEELTNVKSLAIAGHIKPDGDCIGACLAMYTYITTLFKHIEVDLYLEPIPNKFYCLFNSDIIKSNHDNKKVYDLFISLDCGDLKRLGDYVEYFNTAKKTINIDHHISNTSFAQINHILPKASSTCEVIFDLFDEDKIDINIAEALYIGIAHDTGIFKFSNTSGKTMNIVAKLMDKGIEFTKLIDESFYQKTYVQNQILGRCLLESFLLIDSKCIVSAIKKKDLEFFKASEKDLSGIVEQLRITKGVEIAILAYEINPHEYKVSMRSNEIVDVNKVASYFGGGGHIRAAGCIMSGNIHDVINNLTLHIENQLKENEL